jgi:hypothetical protein
MSRAASLLLIAACGRVGFDELEPPTPPDAPAVAMCAAGFEPVANAPLRYRFESTPADWPSALAACRAFGPGHDLALPTSDPERLALAATARAAVVERWWIGGTDAAMENVWVDTSGAPITYLPWAQFEPNNTGGAENCMDLLADPVEGATRTDLFDDRTCTALYPFICACTL